MAILPIDAQLIFAQLDKVGKEQTALREGAAIQKSIAGDREAQKLAQNIESVNAASEDNDPENAGNRQLEQLQDQESRSKREHAPHTKAQKTADDAGVQSEAVIKDPMVGTHIDLEG
jgi:hypothetical protein